MHTIKTVAAILLAIYLILSGLASIAEVQLSTAPAIILGLIGIVSGILIIVSIGQCMHDCRHDHWNNPNDPTRTNPNDTTTRKF